MHGAAVTQTDYLQIPPRGGMESSHISKLHNTHIHFGERVGYRGQSLFITDAGGKGGGADSV